MKKVYTIEILCKDTDNTIYNDNYRKGFATYEIAKRNLNRLIMDEYNDLIETASDNQNYYITDYIDDEKEKCEREIYVETDDYEDLLTRYSIVIIEVEDINTRYDIEEDFAINEELANKINYMVYKGIEVRYIWDTNTIVFSKKYKESLNDEDDLDTIIYRNYTEEDIIRYIEEQLQDFISEDDKKGKRLYHLHNSYGEYNEYTTDENKIIMIYIDEISQCIENNISLNIEESEYKSALNWLYKIYNVCGSFSRKTINIDKIIDELNKEHYWLIEVKEMI